MHVLNRNKMEEYTRYICAFENTMFIEAFLNQTIVKR